MYETLLIEKKDKAFRITLNRPDKRNALTPTMLVELERALGEADSDPEVACVVLRGSGDKAFCAGADLGGMAGDVSSYGRFEAQGLFPKLFLRMEALRKPILAAVNGHAIAGGFGLVMASDLAIAKSGVQMGTPEIARGLFPYMISALILRSVPRRRALEIMLIGELFTSDEAASWSVVNRTVPAESFDETVETWVSKITRYSPAVLGLGRRALNTQDGMPLDGALAYLQGLLTVNSSMEDAMEGISAFFEKREPIWKGR
ncbi:MAG: enoyl-CoA hydratase/isomerase family protein [Deltaproteobacteria bacterium]|nr:enoyl-CoA hydratase/isomerase family protein [Deltaproteobacteria bacterium]